MDIVYFITEMTENNIMKFTDEQCREMITLWRGGEVLFEDFHRVFDALEERLEPTTEEVVAHLERVANEMVVLDYREHRVYATAAHMIREGILKC